VRAFPTVAQLRDLRLHLGQRQGPALLRARQGERGRTRARSLPPTQQSPITQLQRRAGRPGADARAILQFLDHAEDFGDRLRFF
jgi:hypothetical protein